MVGLNLEKETEGGSHYGDTYSNIPIFKCRSLINFLKLKFSAQGRRQKGADGEIVSSGSEDEGGNKAEGGGDRSGDKKRKSRSGKEGKMSRRARKKAERAERKKEMKAQEEGLR